MREPSGKKMLGAAVLVAASVFAACGDDGTGPSSGLRPEDVSSLYSVCSLEFDPAGTVLPSVDIRDAAFEFPGGLRNPVIGLDPDGARTVELNFVPKGQVNDREIHGTYNLRGENSVEIRFSSSGVDPRSFLLPLNVWLDFNFQDSPRRLTLDASSSYLVSRQAYVALSGEEPQNLPESISGTLRASFNSVGCGGE